MKHARKDYDRIQDPAFLIPADEPVFLLRAKDVTAPFVVRHWALLAEQAGADERMVKAAMDHAYAMSVWQKDHGFQVPDMPEDA